MLLLLTLLLFATTYLRSQPAADLPEGFTYQTDDFTGDTWLASDYLPISRNSLGKKKASYWKFWQGSSGQRYLTLTVDQVPRYALFTDDHALYVKFAGGQIAEFRLPEGAEAVIAEDGVGTPGGLPSAVPGIVLTFAISAAELAGFVERPVVALRIETTESFVTVDTKSNLAAAVQERAAAFARLTAE